MLNRNVLPVAHRLRVYKHRVYGFMDTVGLTQFLLKIE